MYKVYMLIIIFTYFFAFLIVKNNIKVSYK